MNYQEFQLSSCIYEFLRYIDDLSLYFFYHIIMQKQAGEEEVVQVPKETPEQLLASLQNSSASLPTDLQRKHVYEVYDKIAPHFSHTRYKPWPKVQSFLNSLQEGSSVVDIGCGNGKYLGVNKNLFMIGTDRSIGLLTTAREKNEEYQLFAADSIYLPLRQHSCDAFISIAVIHHFSTQALRRRALEELSRVTKIGGEGLVYVWAYEQQWQGQQSVSKKKFAQQDVFVPWHLHFKYQADLEKIDTKGCEIDYEKKSVIYKRFYHVFKAGELEKLVSSVPTLKLLDLYYDRQNWCCRVRVVEK